MTALPKLGFVTSGRDVAQEAYQKLSKQYGEVPTDKADVIVAIGGDGALLEALHTHMGDNIPVYGLNLGSVGFLMNDYTEDDLMERLSQTQSFELHPLKTEIMTTDGKTHEALAVNEVSLLRQTHQAAKLQIFIDGVERMPQLICDGILVSTPAGSTAYNYSAHGPIVPIDSKLLALTPISAYRPRRWRGALLPHTSEVEFVNLRPERRPVSATADSHETRNIERVKVREDRDKKMTLLFDPGRRLDERILKEQFAV